MYLLSVVIPTKDRYEYLKGCLNSLVNIQSNDIEIVVQDNTQDNKEIIDYINELGWEHIKYFHDSSELSQTGNSDLAVSHATGEYCTYIGDDDSISIAAIDAVRYLHENNIDACVNNVATYHWPDVVFQNKPKPALEFDASPIEMQKINNDEIMKSFLSWGCQDIKYLPRIYHGIIKRSILESIKEESGSYFPGPSPDMANAVSALLLIKNYIYIRFPLIISGYSFKSAGGMGLRGAHSGSLTGVKQLPKNAEKEWSPRIPKVWLGYTVWPESAEKAFIHMHQDQYIKQINYSAMYAKTFLRYPNYRKMVLENVKGIKAKVKLIYEGVRFMLRWAAEHIRVHKRKRKGTEYVLSEKITLQEACNIVNESYKHKICEISLH